jgi:hypothetical protein
MVLAQHYGFGPAFLYSLLRLVKGIAKLNTCQREECNKYDLTAAPCSWLADHNDWSGWFAISSLPTYLHSQF